MKRKKKTLTKKIMSRLVLEAIVGIALFATYPNWDNIKAAFKAESEPADR
ncbi:MAG: hypothetical protein IKS55_01175 [Oscillospiraceae bacterium]|nr:hypothetical protein [Oscillospiraceae bacterium]